MNQLQALKTFLIILLACYNEQNNVDKEIRKLFPNTKRVVYDEYKNPIDRAGQSTERDIVYLFNDGSEAGTACLKWGKKWLKKIQNLLLIYKYFLTQRNMPNG